MEPETPAPNPGPSAKDALAKIRELKRRLAEAEGARSEPIAIVATACRFPKRSNSPEAFWQSLLEGRDEVSELPDDRWNLDAYYDEDPEAPGKMYARRGAFLESIDGMDADFFGISPREATWIDPQQRLFLEVAWEALERAGWAGASHAKGTGVFVGWMHNDYQNESSESLLDLNPYIATGSAGSFLCGRLSYFLGVQGPSLAVDTACSSSLVALHLACQSLRNRECERALVGGVNVMVSPKTTIMTCKLRALSPEGHSRAFDASADGYLRGEGCGVVALRRLSDALHDGDPVLAVVKGSAVTHNGFSSGLTAPNPESQRLVIRRALEAAGVEPREISYLEAHGTGTELGDPIEMNAAIAVLGEGRQADRPLLVGSVKTNVGHLEAAAGIAGVIKTVLAIEHGRIPAHLHFETPNPHIDWDRLPLRVVTETTPWPADAPRLAGVSAFGMSGTNAHVVIEAPPPRPAGGEPGLVPQSGNEGSGAGTRPSMLLLSARTDAALRESAERCGQGLASAPPTAFRELCRAAATGRRHFERRAAILADGPDEATALLAGLAEGREDPGIVRGKAEGDPLVAWQFTGQGSQYQGMAKGLYESEPVFRATFDECAERLQEWREGDLRRIVFEDGASLARTYWAQPALFAVHVSLAELLGSFGLRPGLVLGHSLGQYAAACAAGILDWRDTIRLIHERSRLCDALPAGGAMAAVFAGPEVVEETLADFPALSLAARNGTHHVLSGPVTALEEALAQLASSGARCKRLETSHAFHSALLDPMLDEFEATAASLEHRPAQIPLVCNLTGEPLPPDAALGGPYWRRQLRETVHYEESLRTLGERSCGVLLELGPQPVLTGLAAASWKGDPGALIPTLREGRPDAESLREALARLHCHGASPDFETLFRGEARGQSRFLPTYPFQRRRHWGPEKPGEGRVAEGTRHPLLGEPRPLAGVRDERRFESVVSPGRPLWLGDHRILDDVVFPGAGFIEMALAAGGGRAVVENLSFETPLVVSEPLLLQTVVRGEGGSGEIEIHSTPRSKESWTRHAAARWTTAAPLPAPEAPSLAELRERCGEPLDIEAFYEMFAGLGLNYGPEFRTVKELRHGGTEIFARLSLPGDQRGFYLSPGLLDGALHSLAAGLLSDPESPLFLPVGVGRVRWLGPEGGHPGGELLCHGRWNETEGERRSADLRILDPSGTPLASLEEVRVREVSRSALRRMVGSGSDRLLYQIAWRPFPATPTERSSLWLVVGEDQAAVASLCSELRSRSQICAPVRLSRESGGEPLRREGEGHVLGATDPASWEALFSEILQGEGSGQLNGVIWTIAPDEGEALASLHCGGVLGLLKALRGRRIEWLDRGLQFVTTLAVPAAEGDRVVPESAQFWGLGRVVGNEYPPLRCRLVDLDGSPESAAALPDAILTESRESQVAIRAGSLRVPRLVPLRTDPGRTAPLQARTDASYLVTGGLGKLGKRAAEWLASRGAGHLVLTSRSEPDESVLEAVEAICAAGCEVRVVRADISDPEAAKALLSRFGSEFPPLRGVVHAAGVLSDGLLAEQSWESFEKVLAPKKEGARALHELTRDLPLDFFILYSSAASVLGSPGQANYATANAFLDGLAQRRAADGLPALSVNFGPWNEGMAATETVTKAVALQGMTPLTADEAHEAMEALLSNGATQATMLDIDWSRMRGRFPVEAPPLLDEIWPEESAPRQKGGVLLDKLKEAATKGLALEEVVAEHVQAELQQVLSLPSPPGPEAPLADLGLDSLMAVEFATRLQQQVGVGYAIPPTVAFDFPSVAKLTAHLVVMLSADPPGETAETARTETRSTGVAVIGLGCRFPGAEGPEAFWRLLSKGIDATVEQPPDRWDEALHDPAPAPGKIYSKRGGFLPDIADFDAVAFGIPERDAAWMDPQHRMLLEVSSQALEHAGIVPGKLGDRSVGVFMGLMSTDYAQIRERLDPATVEGANGAGLSHSAGVGKINHHFGFEGPALAVDTASSSSLVAVHQAARSLLDGECNLALAGGANAILSPVNSLLLSRAKLLAPDGRCKSFSARADGFGRGEGCGVVVLKRLEDAERDGDRILAVIRGGAVGHNGANGGLSIPSERAQRSVIQRALASAGVSPAEVSYLEAHATGTDLGDSIEVRAAGEVLSKGRPEGRELLVGSVKPHIGHLEAAGGVSGLIKTVLCLERGTIPAQIHCDPPNPNIPWERLRAKLVTEARPWPDPERRIAGVTALGMTGTNAHLVLEGAPRPAAAVDLAGPVPAHPPSRHLLVISADSPEALKSLRERHLRRLEAIIPLGDEGAGEASSDAAALAVREFAALCDASGAERRHREHRIALVAENAAEARDSLSRASQPSEHAWAGRRRETFRTAWTFGDESSFAPGLAAELLASEPLAREALEQASALLGEIEGATLLDALLDEDKLLRRPRWSLPALFAVQMATARILLRWGLEPDAVFGHGSGQYAAACAAGMMEWDDGLRLAAKRGELSPEDGGAPPAEALEAFERFGDSIEHRPASLPIHCDLDGVAVPVHRVLAGAHWRRHWEEGSPPPDAALASLLANGIEALVEIGPPSTPVEEALRSHGRQAATISVRTLETDRPSSATLLSTIGRLFVEGVEPDFQALATTSKRDRRPLPETPFRRKRYWIGEARSEAEAAAPSVQPANLSPSPTTP